MRTFALVASVATFAATASAADCTDADLSAASVAAFDDTTDFGKATKAYMAGTSKMSDACFGTNEADNFMKNGGKCTATCKAGVDAFIKAYDAQMAAVPVALKGCTLTAAQKANGSNGMLDVDALAKNKLNFASIVSLCNAPACPTPKGQACQMCDLVSLGDPSKADTKLGAVVTKIEPTMKALGEGCKAVSVGDAPPTKCDAACGAAWVKAKPEFEALKTALAGISPVCTVGDELKTMMGPGAAPFISMLTEEGRNALFGQMNLDTVCKDFTKSGTGRVELTVLSVAMVLIASAFTMF